MPRNPIFIAPPDFLETIPSEAHTPPPPTALGLPARRRTLEYLTAVAERHGCPIADSYDIAIIEDNAGTAAERRGVRSLRIWKRWCPALYRAFRDADLYTTYNKAQDAIYVRKSKADDAATAVAVLRSWFPLVLYVHNGREYVVRSDEATPVRPDNLPTLIEPTKVDLAEIVRLSAEAHDDITGVYVFTTEHGIGSLGEFAPIATIGQPGGEIITRHPATVVRIATKTAGPLYAMYLTQPKHLTPFRHDGSAIGIARDFIDATGEPHVWQPDYWEGSISAGPSG